MVVEMRALAHIAALVVLQISVPADRRTVESRTLGTWKKTRVECTHSVSVGWGSQSYEEAHSYTSRLLELCRAENRSDRLEKSDLLEVTRPFIELRAAI